MQTKIQEGKSSTRLVSGNFPKADRTLPPLNVGLYDVTAIQTPASAVYFYLQTWQYFPTRA